MKRKQVKPQDVKSEDIAKDIEASLYGIDSLEKNPVFKLMTFIMMFFFYIYLSIVIEKTTIKMAVIIFGLIILISLLQGTVLPAFNQKKKKRTILET